MRVALFDFRIVQWFKEMLPVALALHYTGRYAITAVIGWDGEDSSKAVRQCQEAGFTTVLLDQRLRFPPYHTSPGRNASNEPSILPGDHHGGSRLTPAPAVGSVRRPIWHSLAIKLAWRLGLVRLLSFLRHVHMLSLALKVAKRIVYEARPDVVVVGPYLGFTFDIALVNVAHAARIPTLMLPTYFHMTSAEIAEPRVDRSYAALNTQRLLNRLVAGIFPRLAYTYEGKQVLLVPPEQGLAAWCLGVMPSNPWSWGAGPLVKMCLENEFTRGRLLADGVPADKMVVVGRSSMDVTYRMLRAAEGARSEILATLGLSNHERLILLNGPTWGEKGILPWARHWEELEFLLHTLCALPQSRVVLSLHPASTGQEYQALAEKYGAIISRRHGIDELVPLCDVLVSFPSTVVTLAIACHKPAVVFDFLKWDITHVYEGVCSTIVVRDKADLYPLLLRCLTDSAFYAELMEGQKEAAKTWASHFDGRATQRSVDAIERLVHPA